MLSIGSRLMDTDSGLRKGATLWRSIMLRDSYRDKNRFQQPPCSYVSVPMSHRNDALLGPLPIFLHITLYQSSMATQKNPAHQRRVLSWSQQDYYTTPTICWFIGCYKQIFKHYWNITETFFSFAPFLLLLSAIPICKYNIFLDWDLNGVFSAGLVVRSRFILRMVHIFMHLLPPLKESICLPFIRIAPRFL